MMLLLWGHLLLQPVQLSSQEGRGRIGCLGLGCLDPSLYSKDMSNIISLFGPCFCLNCFRSWHHTDLLRHDKIGKNLTLAVDPSEWLLWSWLSSRWRFLKETSFKRRKDKKSVAVLNIGWKKFRCLGETGWNIPNPWGKVLSLKIMTNQATHKLMSLTQLVSDLSSLCVHCKREKDIPTWDPLEQSRISLSTSFFRFFVYFALFFF